jgi:hypothetical protein
MIGPLRINGPPSGGDGSLRMRASDEDKVSDDNYLARLVKLIPSEVIAFYLVGIGLIPEDRPYVQLIWTIVGLIAVIVVRSSASKGLDGKPQWRAVGVATVSFAIWVYSLGHASEAFGVYVPYLGSLLVLTWTFFLPYIYTGS